MTSAAITSAANAADAAENRAIHLTIMTATSIASLALRISVPCATPLASRERAPAIATANATNSLASLAWDTGKLVMSRS